MRSCVLGAIVALATLAGCEEEVTRTPPALLPPTGPPPTTSFYASPQAAHAPQAQAAEKPALRFLEVRGHVTMNHRPISEPVAIQEGAELATGPDGTAIFTMMPGDAMLMRPNTTLTLSHNARGIEVKLHLGALWSVLPKDQVYEVSTATVIASTHGGASQFYVHVDKHKTVDVCDCFGDVQMSTPDGHQFNKVISAPEYEHQGMRFQRKGRKIAAHKLNDMAHTDDGNDDLVTWGKETLPKKKIEIKK